MTQPASHHIRFRGRSFPVLALELEPPLEGWIERLDACLERSPAFFSRKSVVIDVSGLSLDRPDVIGLVEKLSVRGVRIMGLTGVEPSWESPDLPPILSGGRALAQMDEPKAPNVEGGATDEPREEPAPAETASTQDPPPQPASVAPLVVETVVRSGQSIFQPEGDVIVIGSVASGADISASGSVHIYGTLRGRVMSGVFGDTRARIFCRRLEAELLAIGGVFMTADEMEPAMRGHPVQVWLENETIKIAKLD